MSLRSLILATLATPLVQQATAQQVTIDVTRTNQVIRGIGYSEAFQRAQWVYNNMSDTAQQEMFDLLHDPAAGAGFSILRLGIGSSASSSKDWMNSIEPVSPGLANDTAVYAWDRNDSSQIWWAKEVQKRGVGLFYGNSWGADAYMKTTNDTDNGGYLCGVSNTTECETGDWRQQYSDKLVQWVKNYADEGINITHLGFLNEPDIAVSYASMQADGFQATEILDVLRPTVDAAGIDVKITCCDWAGYEDGRVQLKNMQDAGGEAMLDVVTTHGYGQPLGLPYETDKEVWQSEWAELSSTFDQPWYTVEGDVKGTYGGGQGLTWANRLMQGFTVANMSAFINWMGAQPSNAATPVIRTINDTNILSKRYWAYAAFGRYARPGSERVSANTTAANVTVAAWIANGSFPAGGNLAVQLINNADEDRAVTLDVSAIESVNNMTVYLLNNDFDLALNESLAQASGLNVTATIPPRSLVILALDATWP